MYHFRWHRNCLCFHFHNGFCTRANTLAHGAELKIENFCSSKTTRQDIAHHSHDVCFYVVIIVVLSFIFQYINVPEAT